MREQTAARTLLARSNSAALGMQLRGGSLTERRLRLLAEHTADIALITTTDGVIQWACPALEQHLGVRQHQLVGTDAFEVVHPDDRPAVQQASATLASGRMTALACRLQHIHDGWRWHNLVLSNHQYDPAICGQIWNAHDITLERLYAGHPAHDALRDPLTRLPNRTLLLELGDAALARVQRANSRLAMLLIDLDRFKVVNDSAGHAAGDLLLTITSRRLLDCIRTGDTVARVGSDEFVILLEHLNDPSDVITVARRVQDALRQPFVIAGTEISSGASIGITISAAPDESSSDSTGTCPERATHSQSFGDLLRNADIATRQAKANGGGVFVEYAEHMDAPWRQRLALESDLQRAIARKELRLDFQPEIDSATGQIVSLEALVRWMHPQHGLLAPDRFIPMAEETGQIVALGDWVLQEACTTLHGWRQRFPDAGVRVSVNLSTRQLEQPDFVERVADTLRRTGVAPEDLCLELTESTYLQDGGTPDALLRELHALGVHLAIDDFGIGYSSLAYLTRLQAQVLKIDRSFIAAFGQGNGTEAIVRAIVSLAHALGMSVTAEGIETAEQRALVEETGCDRLQGYHFSRPRPAADIDALLSDAPAWQQPGQRKEQTHTEPHATTAADTSASSSTSAVHLHEDPA